MEKIESCVFRFSGRKSQGGLFLAFSWVSPIGLTYTISHDQIHSDILNQSIDIMKSLLTRVTLLLIGLLLGCTQLSADLPSQDNALGHQHHWVTRAMNSRNIEQHIIYSDLAKQEVSYHVFTPPQYRRNTVRRYPVLYWLHGSLGGVHEIRPISRFFLRAIREGRIPPMLVVFPNGMAKTLWVDSKDGQTPVESVFIKEILPDVDARYRTIPTRAGRLIEGFSMGGFGAARFGLKYNDIFGGISMLAAGPLQASLTATNGPKIKEEDRIQALKEVFGNDEHYFESQSPWVLAEQYARRSDNRLQIRQVIGSRDHSLPANEAFSEHLTKLNIPHEFDIVPGVGHRALMLLRGLGEKNWQFYRNIFAHSEWRGGFARQATLGLSSLDRPLRPWVQESNPLQQKVSGLRRP